MQYLLTEEEMQEVRELRALASKLPDLNDLAETTKHIADNMIDLKPVNGHEPTGRPYGCAYTPGPSIYRYCDGCPVRGICPRPKRWSK